MVTVGVREFRDHLARYLRRVKAGESVLVTVRGRPVAVLAPMGGGQDAKDTWVMVAQGLVQWNGGKPCGSPHLARNRGATAAEAVLQDRRG